jgi:hypothetical protein
MIQRLLRALILLRTGQRPYTPQTPPLIKITRTMRFTRTIRRNLRF